MPITDNIRLSYGDGWMRALNNNNVRTQVVALADSAGNVIGSSAALPVSAPAVVDAIALLGGGKSLSDVITAITTQNVQAGASNFTVQFPTSMAVTGAFYPSVQEVSGTVSVTNASLTALGASVGTQADATAPSDITGGQFSVVAMLRRILVTAVSLATVLPASRGSSGGLTVEAAAMGAKADAAADNDSGVFSLVSLVKRILTQIAVLLGILPTARGGGGGLLVDSTATPLAVANAGLSNLNLTTTGLRDALSGAGAAAKTLADIVTAMQTAVTTIVTAIQSAAASIVTAVQAGPVSGRTYYSGQISLSGTGQIVPAVSGKSFRCTAIQYSVTLAATTYLRSNLNSLEGAGKSWALGAGPDRILNQGYLFTTNPGEALTLYLSVGGASGSVAGYYE